MPAEPGAATAAKNKAEQAASAAAEGAQRVGRTVKRAARKTSGTAKAVRAARAGRVDEAQEVVDDAQLGEGLAAKATAKAEGRHYQVEVNKRSVSVTALTKTLNDRWDSGWRLAHILEQRGNTVLVFEKRE